MNRWAPRVVARLTRPRRPTPTRRSAWTRAARARPPPPHPMTGHGAAAPLRPRPQLLHPPANKPRAPGRCAAVVRNLGQRTSMREARGHEGPNPETPCASSPDRCGCSRLDQPGRRDLPALSSITWGADRAGRHQDPCRGHRTRRQLPDRPPVRGAHSDGPKNVLAKGSATLTTGGKTYQVDRPEVIGMAQVYDELLAEGAAPAQAVPCRLRPPALLAVTHPRRVGRSAAGGPRPLLGSSCLPLTRSDGRRDYSGCWFGARGGSNDVVVTELTVAPLQPGHPKL